MKRKDRMLRSLPNLTPELYKAQMASYYGWCKWVDGRHLMRKVFGEYYELFDKKHKKKKNMEAVRLSDTKNTWYGMGHDRFISTRIDNNRTLYEKDFIVLEYQMATFDNEEGIVVHLLIDDEHYYTITKSISLVQRIPKAWERVGCQPFLTRLKMQPSQRNPRNKYPVLV